MTTKRLTIEADVDIEGLPMNKLLVLTGYLKILPNGKAEVYNLQLEWNPNRDMCDHLFTIGYRGDQAYGRCVKCGKNNDPEGEPK